MIHYAFCPACGAASIRKVFCVTDHTVSGDAFEVWQCAACSLRFTQDVPAEEKIGAYYRSEDYISHTETREGLVNRLYMLVRRFTLRDKKQMICRETGLQKGRLLDVGAGTGAFAHTMQVAGWEVTGLEPDEGAIQRAAEIYRLQLQPSEQLFHLEENSYDAVTLWHVLEHVHRLHEYLEQIKRVCRHGGKIFIAVPNYTSVDAERYGPFWAAYDVPRHLYHFSPAAMDALVKRHGCRISKIRPMWFDSFYVSLLSEKYRTGRARLIPGGLSGLRSNLRAVSRPRRASSLIYVIEAR